LNVQAIFAEDIQIMILEHKGTSIFYQDQGKGTAVVLLHGFLENSEMWEDVQLKLVQSHRVVSIDLLGHGQTGCLGYVHSMELMAEAVHAVLKSLRLRRVILIGHSMGGYVSLAFAEQYPKMVKGLCLMDSTAQADSEERKELRARANKMVQTNFENMVRMSVGNLFKPESLELFADEVKWVKEEALKTPIQGYIACMEGMRIRPNRVAVLHTVENVLYVIGKYDPVLEANNIVEEAKSINAEFVVLEGGHMSHVENKEELVNALCVFVKSF
jgi:pimeloyl-ACP methyl ester carboxylesterase